MQFYPTRPLPAPFSENLPGLFVVFHFHRKFKLSFPLLGLSVIPSPTHPSCRPWNAFLFSHTFLPLGAQLVIIFFPHWVAAYLFICKTGWGSSERRWFCLISSCPCSKERQQLSRRKILGGFFPSSKQDLKAAWQESVVLVVTLAPLLSHAAFLG